MNKRLFISISLPPAWLDQFESYAKQYRDKSVRWIEKVNIHVTVHFMGSTPEQEIVPIQKKMEAISIATPPFALEFSKIDFAPPGKTKRMIWAYFLPSKNFDDLVQKIQDTIGDGGARRTEGEPLPHATLARFKDYRVLKGLSLKEPSLSRHSERAERLIVNSFELQESELLLSGARYKALHSFPLKGSS